MADKTKIAWTDATWNVVTGCTKVSEGCRFCYAERDFHRPYPGRRFGDVVCHADRMMVPERWLRPRMIFVCSMGDLFHKDVPEAFIDEVFATMVALPRHTFQVLTKRPERQRDYMLTVQNDDKDMERWLQYRPGAEVEWPPRNIWLGTSVETQARLDERLPVLAETPAAVRFVSAEPLLEPLCRLVSVGGRPRGVDWVIVGGESGPRARECNVGWIRMAVEQCRTSGVPVFVKQLGASVIDVGLDRLVNWPNGPQATRFKLKNRAGADLEEWPLDLRVREFPREGRQDG